MKKNKIVLVAGDFAQSEVLRTLSEKLAESHEERGFLCYGKPDQFSLDSIREGVQGMDWLVAGMSELSTSETTAVDEAIKQSVRIALYADTFGAHSLSAFEFVRDIELTLFVINDEEANDARKMFPRANIQVTGNPRWEEFAFPRLSRREARHALGVEDDRRIILCPGDKYLAQNMIQFGATIDAVQKLGWEKQTEIVIGLHPGEPNNPKLYDDIVERAGCSVRIIGQHVGINTGDVLTGSDLIVEFTSTIGIQAACLRIPVIDFCSTVAMRGRRPVEGEDPWKLVKSGASIPIYFGSSNDLAGMMFNLENTSLSMSLRVNQERMFPVPPTNERGQALKRMSEVLST